MLKNVKTLEIAYLIFGLLIFYYININYHPLILIAVAILYFSKNHKYIITTTTSILIITFTTRLYWPTTFFFTEDKFKNYLLEHKINIIGQMRFLNILVFAIMCGLVFVLASLYKKYLLRFRSSTLIVFLSLFMLLLFLILLIRNTDSHSNVYIILSLLLFSTGKMFWYIVLFIRQQAFTRQFSFKEGFNALILPFWDKSNNGRDIINIQRYESPNAISVGVKLLLRAAVVYILLMNLNIMFDFSFDINNNFKKIAITYQTASSLSLWYKMTYAVFLFYMYSFFIVPDITIGIANLSGYNLQPNTSQPWRAKSIAEFWGRTSFYINFILTNHFLIPLFGFFRFLKYNTLRKFIAFFCAFILFNITYHLTRGIFLFTDSHLEPAIRFIAERFPVYILNGFLVTMSFVFLKKFEEKLNLIAQKIWIVFYYTVFLGISIMHIYLDQENLFLFIKKLLFLS